MSTCCPNCASSALGSDAASICAECVSVSVAGASMSLPMMLLTGVLVAGALLVGRALVRSSRRARRLAMG